MAFERPPVRIRLAPPFLFFMFTILRSLPIALIFFFYWWGVAAEFGSVLGLHLTSIAFSFFVLCTPIASYFYLAGLLPIATNRDTSLFKVMSFWLLSLLINVITIFTVPKIYSKVFICKVVHSLLTAFPINILTLMFSLGFLVYHWILFKIPSKTLRNVMHGVGVLLSMTAFYGILTHYHDTMVFYLVDMSNSNF